MISINNNLSALNTAHALGNHYGRLQTSAQRLSSGLRINSAADDAAGLAIRELMRADIAALNQGVRNANDAISMLQTFDGALSVIDEKLIRMKELAEQAATGTYDSTQRLMIDSEFQAMGSEINRIANATDFNGIKLLCTPMITWFTDEEQFVVTDSGTIRNMTLSGGQNPAITQNINAANLVSEANPIRTISVSLTAKSDTKTIPGTLEKINTDGTIISYRLNGTDFSVAFVNGLGGAKNPIISYDTNSADNGGWSITDENGKYNINTPGDGTTRIGGSELNSMSSVFFELNDAKNNPVNLGKMDPKIQSITISTTPDEDPAGNFTITKNITVLDNIPTAEPYTASYDEDTKTISVNLKSDGGSATMVLNNPLAGGDSISFDITLAGEVQTVPVEHHAPDPAMKVKIHFGTMNDSAEDYYYINYENCTLEGLGLDGVDIQTQEKAQSALTGINDAIVLKDKVRANYGALQNRFENTATNLRIQAENLQNAESRISDAEIATEMMNFVRNQILTNSAVAMLAQANSLPQMVMALIR